MVRDQLNNSEHSIQGHQTMVRDQLKNSGHSIQGQQQRSEINWTTWDKVFQANKHQSRTNWITTKQAASRSLSSQSAVWSVALVEVFLMKRRFWASHGHEDSESHWEVEVLGKWRRIGLICHGYANSKLTEIFRVAKAKLREKTSCLASQCKIALKETDESKRSTKERSSSTLDWQKTRSDHQLIMGKWKFGGMWPHLCLATVLLSADKFLCHVYVSMETFPKRDARPLCEKAQANCSKKNHSKLSKQYSANKKTDLHTQYIVTFLNLDTVLHWRKRQHNNS